MMILTPENISTLPPALILIVGALLIPLFSGRVKSAYMLSLPILAMVALVNTPLGEHGIYTVMIDYQVIFGRVDALSRIFGFIFIIAAFAGTIYSLDVKGHTQHVAGLIYAGSAIGVTFSGDFFSFYIFWELMAIASTFLILARKTKRSQGAAVRYILVHIFGGLALLAGIIMQVSKTGTIAFDFIGLDSPASWFIFVGVAVNAAVFPLHGWLKDAYPEATASGAVFLSTFTTKSAVYVMARMFPGVELLIILGAVMAVVPLFYGLIENDIRRVLSYCIINQVGFMLIGIGIGTELAINGAAAHAFCHILYKALLFMSAGAVLHTTGKTKCTDLGGLYRSMPLTCLFGMIGAASIAFPFFCGFVSKSMTISASAHEKMVIIWLVFQFAAAGAFLVAGIKVNYFTFFGKDSGLRPKEAPLNKLLAMGLVAALCVYVGIHYQLLYDYLPYQLSEPYHPYTGAHIVGQLQLLVFTGIAFALLLYLKIYPTDERAENLDIDWLYRKGASIFYFMTDIYLNLINKLSDMFFVGWFTGGINRFAARAPLKLSLWVIVPAQVLTLRNKTQRAVFKKQLSLAYKSGAMPVGVGAMLAVLFIVLLYVCFMDGMG